MKKRMVISRGILANPGNAGSRWELTLECGHRTVRRRRVGTGNRNWKTHDAPKFVFCTKCK